LHCYSGSLLRSGFLTKTLYVFSSLRSICPSHLILRDFIAVVTSVEASKWRGSSLCSFFPAYTYVLHWRRLTSFSAIQKSGKIITLYSLILLAYVTGKQNVHDRVVAGMSRIWGLHIDRVIDQCAVVCTILCVGLTGAFVRTKFIGSYLVQILLWWYAVAQLVEALRYKPDDCGCNSRYDHWNFSLRLISSRHGLGVASVANRNEYQGVKADGT
jgi:hypothetical protein